MREIKFRAWDKISRQMSDPFGLGVHPYLDTQWPGFPKMDMDLEIMQFTGLHDRNGKEIWECDILRSRYGETGEVCWCDSIGAWSWAPGENWGMIDGGEVEVIGNIYEDQKGRQT